MIQRPQAAGHDARFVIALSVGQLISWGSVFYLFALLAGPVERELGLSRAESSLAFSLALLVEGLSAFPVGRWIDRGHERAVMAGGSALLALGLALHRWVDSAWTFQAVWALMGAGMAATLYSPAFAVVTRRFPHDFRRAIITLTFLGGLASTVFIPMIATLFGSLGWRDGTLVLALLHAGLCLPLHATLLRNAPRPTRFAALSSGSEDGPAHRAEKPGLGTLMRSPAFLLLALFTVALMAVTTALPAHMISLLRESGLPESWVIAIPASIGAIQVLGRLLLYFAEHRMDVHRANALIPCLVPLGLAALLLGGTHVAGALLFVTLYGLGNGMLTIVKGTAMAQYVSRDHVASLNGALGLPQAAARALAPLALGLLWSPSVGYRWGLWLLLALCVAGVLALWQAQWISLRRASPAP